ncbi:MAG: hypothetical protein H0U70_02525 [Tatlockia sp.]|nr:hypothetical protein [Tatlockia sp.]
MTKILSTLLKKCICKYDFSKDRSILNNYVGNNPTTLNEYQQTIISAASRFPNILKFDKFQDYLSLLEQEVINFFKNNIGGVFYRLDAM